jgi:hypothetical protein
VQKQPRSQIMKKLSLFLALLISWGLQATLCADDSLDNVLVKYDFNFLKNDCDPNEPSYCAPCVWTTDLGLSHLDQKLLGCGSDGTQFRNFSGWDIAYDYSFARTDFSPAPGALSYDLFVRPDAIANISGVSFDWLRPDCNSVDSIQATIFWQSTGGGIEYLSTGPITLDAFGSWNSRVLEFPIDVNPLPTGIDTSGKQFHVEIYAWGAAGGPLYLDNVALLGNCAPIPEPGGALLIATAGIALLLRRRLRN